MTAADEIRQAPPGEASNGSVPPPRRPARPQWRAAFDVVEGQLAPVLEQLVRSEVFATSMTTLTRLEARCRRQTERYFRRYWHFWDLPTASDVRRLSEHVSLLDQRIRELADRASTEP